MIAAKPCSQRLLVMVVLLVVLLISFSQPKPAHAAVLLSNMPATYDSFGPLDIYRGAGFTVPADSAYQLESVTVHVSGMANSSSFDFSLYSDSGGVPGAELQTLGSITADTLSAHTLTPSSPIPLATGQTYWIVGLRTAGSSGGWTGTHTSTTSSFGFVHVGIAYNTGTWGTSGSAYVYQLDGVALSPTTVSSITRTDTTPTTASNVSWTVTFANPVSYLTTSNFTLAQTGVSGASITSVTPTGSAPAATWTVTASTGSGDGTLGLNFTGTIGLVPAVSNTLTGETYTIDRTPPDTVITNTPPNPSGSTSAIFSFTGSDALTGVAAFYCQLDGGGFTLCVSPESYNGLSGGTHTFEVRAEDSVGNVDNTPATYSWTIDTDAPSVSIVGVSPNPRNTAVASISIDFTEPVLNFDLADLTLTRDSTPLDLTGLALTPQAGDIYTLDDLTALTTPDGTYTLTLAVNNITDAAGTPLVVGDSTSWVMNTIVPLAAFATTAGDPTNVSPIPFTLTFSKPVLGLDSSEIVVTNGTLGSFTGSGDTYTFDVTPASFGLVSLNLPAGAAQDDASNQSEPASYSIRYDSSSLPPIIITLYDDGTDAVTTIRSPSGSGTFTVTSGSDPRLTLDSTTGAFVFAFEPGAPEAAYSVIVQVDTSAGEVFMQEVRIIISAMQVPPPTPLCEDHNFAENGVVRSSTADAFGYALNCRILYQNGAPTQWLGGDLYNSGSIGVEGIVDLGIHTAIDIFSPSGTTYYNGGAVFCLKGSGWLIWLAASQSPRHPEIIGSYTVPEFPGFTCATLFEPGTLVLVSQNPVR